MSSDIVYVTKLDSNGLPSDPPLKQGKRSNVLPDKIWRQVPVAIKDKIWSNMKGKNQVSSWCRGRCEECDLY
jgi:hypothetical protein